MSKRKSPLLWVWFITPYDWSRTLGALSQLLVNQTKTNRVLLAHFPALYTIYFNCFELIGSLSCLRLLRLVRIIYLVWARRHLETAHVASLRHLFLLWFPSVDWNSFSQCERYSGKKCSVIFINKKTNVSVIVIHWLNSYYRRKTEWRSSWVVGKLSLHELNFILTGFNVSVDSIMLLGCTNWHEKYLTLTLQGGTQAQVQYSVCSQ